MTLSGFVSENQLYARCVTLFKPRKQQQKQPRGCLCLSSNFTVESHSSEVSVSCKVALTAYCKKKKISRNASVKPATRFPEEL